MNKNARRKNKLEVICNARGLKRWRSFRVFPVLVDMYGMYHACVMMQAAEVANNGFSDEWNRRDAPDSLVVWSSTPHCDQWLEANHEYYARRR